MTEREIFVAALHQPGHARRRAFLDDACGDDPDLRGRVEALLAEHDRLGSFLERPAVAPPETVAVEPPAGPTVTAPPPRPADEAPGGRIGPYKLLEVIAEGGMGAVWMADQLAPIRRRVALKVVKPGMDSRQVLARFEAERQALALMDHPNIARVLDAGTTDSGRPYFAMELVKGVPITRFCDDRQLGVAERLRIFQQVCHAVQHAHQKGVIHRDLKPTNVLVESHEGRPVPKVIDFGLAKAVGATPLTDRSLFTHFGAILGTPLYMAPEHAEFGALDVDTRADVYALGVILYELLTGTTPIERARLAQAAWDEVRRVIKEEEPPTPSARLSTAEGRASAAARRQMEPARLSRFLRGDLDWVAMKALAKERDRRYESAGAFAADVQRFLDQEPVAAGPPTAGYRLRKLARRHRTALATAAVVAAALVIGTAASLHQAARAVDAERLASTRLGRERSARQEADRLLGAVTQERNRADLARREADRRAAEAREVVDFLINDLIAAAAPSRTQGEMPTVDQVLARADGQVAAKFGGQPLVEASIRQALGHAYSELGLYDKAERHAARATELRLAHLGPGHPETIDAQITQATVLMRQGKKDEIRALLAPVLEAARKAFGPEDRETLKVMNLLGLALPLNEAVVLQEELLATYRRRFGDSYLGTLTMMNNLASTRTMLRDRDRALEPLEAVVAAQLRDHPNHPDTFITMSNLALAYRSAGRTGQAADLMRRCLESSMRVLGVPHPSTRGSRDVYLGDALGDRRELERGLPVLEHGLGRARREHGPGSRVAAGWTHALATLLVALGRADEALALVEGLPGDREPPEAEDLKPHSDLALVLREHGRFAEARRHLEQVLDDALRLRRGAGRPDPGVERERGIAQFLLARWPGPAPGTAPGDRPPASTTLDAPYRATGPVADGRIDEGEYGAPVGFRFDDDANPGRLYAWGKARAKSPDDLSVALHAAYTDKSLFLAFRVRDQAVDAGGRANQNPALNDGVEVFIDGDRVANDMTAVRPGGVGNREGFQLLGDAGGLKQTVSGSFTDRDWTLAAAPAPGGYVVEFEIPLALIDTRDGPETAHAAPGDELRVNFGVTDVDGGEDEQTDYGIFWAEDVHVSPLFGGEDFWTVGLRLAPGPGPGPRPEAVPGAGGPPGPSGSR